MLQNGVCDAACNTPDCKHDDGDCVRTRQTCAAGCTKAILDNDVCDAACNTEDCI
jgi:hypothetical protein